MARHHQHRHSKNRHNINHNNFEDNRKTSYTRKFFFWFLVYIIFITLFITLLKDTKVYEAKIGFYLIMGFLLVVISRIVYSAKNQSRFKFSGIFIWGIIYSAVYGLLSKILSILPQIQVNPTYDIYINITLFSVIFTIIIMFLRRMKIKTGKPNRRTPLFLRAPSQIISGIGLFIVGLLVFRFSYQIFVGWFNWAEGMAWSWLIGLIFIIAGLLTLKAWWKNNVSNFNSQHNFNWK